MNVYIYMYIYKLTHIYVRNYSQELAGKQATCWN